MYNQYIRSKNVKWVQDQDDIQTGVRKTIPKAIQTRATIVMSKKKKKTNMTLNYHHPPQPCPYPFLEEELLLRVDEGENVVVPLGCC